MNKAKMTLTVLLLAVLAVGLLGNQATAKDSIDYQKKANEARWRWIEGLTDPLGCIGDYGGKYDIRLVSDTKKDRHFISLAILSGEREIHNWQGHPNSVFAIFQDCLYYAIFSTHSTGGIIVAVDLKTGKKLWESKLKAMGPMVHSGYSSLLNIDCNQEVVTIYGNESMGRYIEIKRADTGETVGHKIFPKEKPDTNTNGPAVSVP